MNNDEKHNLIIKIAKYLFLLLLFFLPFCAKAGTVTLGSSVKANELTIDASQILDLGDSGYTLTISGDGQSTNRPLQNNGILDRGSNSTIEYIASQSTDIEDIDYFNLKLASASTTFYLANSAATAVVSGSFTIEAGTFNQADDNITVNGSTAVSVGTNGEWSNISTGDLTLGGSFDNAGSVSFDTNDSACTNVADDIQILSTVNGTQRTWSGTTGTWNMYNVYVKDMTRTDSPNITVYDGSSSNVTGNWTFGTCAANEPPAAPTLDDTPAFANMQTYDTTPELGNFKSADPESDNVEYECQWDEDYNFGSPASTSVGPMAHDTWTSCIVPTALTNETTYWWQVKARDPSGSNTWSSYSGKRSISIDTSLTLDGWFQTTDEQFDTGTLTGTATNAPNDQVKLQGFSPFLYVYQNNQYVFFSDFLGKAGAQIKEYTDFINLTNKTDVVDGKIKLKITEEMDETAYIDQIYLLVDGQGIIYPSRMSEANFALIRESDDKYLVMEKGDEFYLEFNVLENYSKIEFAAEGYYIVSASQTNNAAAGDANWVVYTLVIVILVGGIFIVIIFIKTKKKRIGRKIITFLLIFLIMTGWPFSNWPILWQIAAAAALPSELRPVTPDGSLTNVQFSSGTVAWSLIDDDPDSADTADYIYETSNITTTAFLNITNMPADFGSMDTLWVKIYLDNTLTWNDDTSTLYAQMFQLNESSTLSDEMQLATQTTADGVINVQFTNVTASDKTTWDDARLRFRWVNVKNTGPDNDYLRVAAAELTGTYSPAAPAVVDQAHFRWRNDNGGETGLSDGMNATDLLGQLDGSDNPVYNSCTADNGDATPPNARGFNTPQGNAVVDTVNNRLFIADRANNRVLVFNLDTNNNLIDRVADNVLGQANFESKTAACAQSGMSSPMGVAYDSVNNKLFVAESGNNRVLVFNLSGGITNGMNASNVLGQANFTSCTVLSCEQLEPRLNDAQGVEYDSGNSRLFVADMANHRVLVFDLSGGITDGMNASKVLGQSTFNVCTSGGCTQTGMNWPVGLAYDSGNNRLFVGDNANERVLVHNVNPATISNGQNADYVLGADGSGSFTTCTAVCAQDGMNGPEHLDYDSSNSRLIVADTWYYRVLIFDLSGGITSGMNASNVLGQSNFTTCTSSGCTQSGMNLPYGVGYESGNSRLYVTDRSNNRETIFQLASASWKQDEDIAHSNQAKSENARLRFSIKNTGGAAVNYQFELQVAPKGGAANCETVASSSYSVVPTTTAGCGSSVACMTNSGYFSNGDSTIEKLTPEGTFTAGKMVEDPSNISGAITINQNYFTEAEYNFQFTTNATDGATYCFRTTNNGALLNIPYAKVAEITIAGGDVTDPTINTLSPADNATDVAVDSNLVITFSEAVDAETGYINLYKTVGDVLVQAFDVTTDITGSGTATITANPTSNLLGGTDYYVKIDATAFDDAAGNSFAGIADTTTWNFTTVAAEGTIMSPEIDFDWVTGQSTWGTAAFGTTETNGDVKLKVYYTVTTACDTIVPDGTLSGNSTGFDVSASPINISGLTPVATTYNRICLQATLTEVGGTPYLNDWTVTWGAVENQAPTIGEVSLNGKQSPIVLLENSQIDIIASVSVTDANGCSDISGVKAIVYRYGSGLTASCSEDPFDPNNCYDEDQFNCVADGSCVGNTQGYNCYASSSMYFFANPTDAGSSFSADEWVVSAVASDSVWQDVASNSYDDDNETDIEVQTLVALEVTAGDPINYGEVIAGQNTGSTNQSVTIKNTGNRGIDVYLQGTDLTGACGTITVGNQEYNDTTPFSWGSGIDLTGSNVRYMNGSVSWLKPTSTTPVTNNIYWGIGVPAETGVGSCNGTNTFTATENN